MSIHIDERLCIGCSLCTKACPGNLLYMVEDGETRKANIRDVRDCWGCTACVKVCPTQAIGYYLGAELGGSGSLLYVRNTDRALEWIIKKGDGSQDIIEVDKTKSNEY